MQSAMQEERSWMSYTRRYVLTGVLTVIPIWITVVVFSFIFKQLSNLGLPVVQTVAKQVNTVWPNLAQVLLNSWFQSALAVTLTLTALYLLGWAATKMVGARLIQFFDTIMQRIPLVQAIYGSTKKLLSALQQKPDQVQRVVLINFPSKGLKAVGFVTRLLTDEDSGMQLAAVFVPTTPNPTSGYLEIVPVEQLISTDWTMDQAMTFIISGGTVAPPRIHYSKSVLVETE